MQSLSLQPSATREEPFDPAAEVARLESLLTERRAELTALQEEMHTFKIRYTEIVGSRLAELAEIEQTIKQAEARLNDPEGDAQAEEREGDSNGIGTTSGAEKSAVGNSLRNLFWSVAKLFHPDHAADETEARRRHQIMVEASRAYREGDAESLHTLLGDEELHFYCTRVQAADTPEGLQDKIMSLKEELRTVEFGIQRLTQNGLYRIKLAADEEATHGRDALAEEAKRINRQIVKARHRLTNLI
ncbi:MAG TPA: hypothetical protein VK388_01835 [Pyrinomonadaceae bacterium]|nr:hypothetical protein [Pyrinomonadaceae bacterium]